MSSSHFGDRFVVARTARVRARGSRLATRRRWKGSILHTVRALAAGLGRLVELERRVARSGRAQAEIVVDRFRCGRQLTADGGGTCRGQQLGCRRRRVHRGRPAGRARLPGDRHVALLHDDLRVD